MRCSGDCTAMCSGGCTMRCSGDCTVRCSGDCTVRCSAHRVEGGMVHAGFMEYARSFPQGHW